MIFICSREPTTLVRGESYTNDISSEIHDQVAPRKFVLHWLASYKVIFEVVRSKISDFWTGIIGRCAVERWKLRSSITGGKCVRMCFGHNIQREDVCAAPNEDWEFLDGDFGEFISSSYEATYWSPSLTCLSLTQSSRQDKCEVGNGMKP